MEQLPSTIKSLRNGKNWFIDGNNSDDDFADFFVNKEQLL